MKLFVCDDENGWRSYSMLQDDTYHGSGYRYWLGLVVGDAAWADIPVTDNVSYYFQEWDTFESLPANACASTTLDPINPCASTWSRDFLAAPDIYEASTDADGDGYNDDVDCDDNDATIFPGAIEDCDGVDQDCDGTVDEGYPDDDGDGAADCIVGAWDYCSPQLPCDVDEGDCDSDSDCKGGLICIHEVGADFGFDPGVDVCGTAPPLGDWDYCSYTRPCGAGEGDCDKDSECQNGLVCVSEVGAAYGFASNVDVCEQP